MATALRYSRIATIVLALLGLVAVSPYAQTITNAECAVYSIYSTVQTIIFVLGIMLMILGATLYAGSQLMPGQSRGQIQGYGMGMVMGGIAGVIIAILSPWILGVASGGSAATNIAAVAKLCK